MDPDAKRIAARSLAHIDRIEQELHQTYPGCWEQLDQLRTSSGMSWANWCLLPMAASVAVVTSHASSTPQPHSIAQLSAMYAWRFSRSVYVIEPTLAHVLMDRVPDTVSLEDFAGLPEWCVYVAGDDTGVGGFWAHLEHDSNTGCPELRILLENKPGAYVPIPVYLDRPSTTDALADFRATGNASSAGVRGANIRNAQPDATTARLADHVDGYLNVLLYLASQHADIVHADRPGVEPVKPRRPKKRGNNTVWLVGYHQ